MTEEEKNLYLKFIGENSNPPSQKEVNELCWLYNKAQEQNEKRRRKMWKPGNLVTIKERIPFDGNIVELSNTCRVIKNSGAHRCINCPMQQKYCDIDNCEQNLPINCTLKKVKEHGEAS